MITTEYVRKKILIAQTATNYPEEQLESGVTQLDGINLGRLTANEAHLYVATIEAKTLCQQACSTKELNNRLNNSQVLELLFKNQVVKRCKLSEGDEFSIGPGFILYVKMSSENHIKTCDDTASY